MNTQDNSAFPIHEHNETGLTLRQYAAIKLKVPDSGLDWLDDMIARSLCDDFAAKAMQSLITVQFQTKQAQSADTAYEWADAMMVKATEPS